MAEESSSPVAVGTVISGPTRVLIVPPDDILVLIFEFMPCHLLANMAMVCSRWNYILWRNLRHLSIFGARKIGSKELRQVAERSQKLRSLTICNARWFVSEYAFEIMQMRELHALTLNSCKQLSGIALTLIQNHPTLTELDLADLTQMQSIPKLPPNLTRFSLRRVHHGSNPLPLLCGLSNLQSLRIADVHSYIANPKTGESYPSNLTSLDLARAQLSVASVAAIARLTRLEHLKLDGNRDLDSKALTHLTKLTTLKSLSLDECSNVTNNGIYKLCRALTSLEHFSTVSSGWRGDSLECLSSLKKLHTLAVSTQRPNSAALVSLMRNPSLTDVKLSNCAFDNSSDARLFKLMTRIRYLDLNETNFGHPALIVHLTDLKFLSVLKLAQNEHLTCSALSGLKTLPCLAQLDAGKCLKLDDDLGQALAPFPALTSLDISFNLITDAGLGSLLALPRLLDLYIVKCPNITSRAEIAQNPPSRDGVPMNIFTEPY